MSIAFREVFEEFDKVSFDNKCLTRNNRISDAFHIGEKLLLSSNNMRPKSRSKSSIGSYGISKLLSQDNELKHQTPILTAVNLLNTDSDIVKDKNSKHIGNEEIYNDGNSNAHCYLDTSNESLKKGKRSRKRLGATVKNKKGKQGRVIDTTVIGRHEKQSSLSTQHILPNTQSGKPSRISSEPSSKGLQTSFLSNKRQDSDDGFAQSQVHSIPFSNVHNLYPLRVASAKTNSSSLPISHYMQDNLACIPNTTDLNSRISMESQVQPVVIYKLEMNPRVKSATSTAGEKNALDKERDISNVNEDISVNAVSCNLQHVHRSSKTVVKYQHNSSSQGLSPDLLSKQAVLTSIYGAVYNTADKLSAQMEQFKKVKKIFLSEKQSGTIRENGMEFPCAPPATPTPDLMKKHEYIPCMSDIRSQRAVKSRLQEMEKEAAKKQEKRKEANVKLEKQQQKEKEKLIKVKQRREIYALNKVMTDLENKRFMDFCQGKGLNEL